MERDWVALCCSWKSFPSCDFCGSPNEFHEVLDDLAARCREITIGKTVQLACLCVRFCVLVCICSPFGRKSHFPGGYIYDCNLVVNTTC